jgi:hypothetical protein
MFYRNHTKGLGVRGEPSSGSLAKHPVPLTKPYCRQPMTCLSCEHLRHREGIPWCDYINIEVPAYYGVNFIHKRMTQSKAKQMGAEAVGQCVWAECEKSFITPKPGEIGRYE